MAYDGIVTGAVVRELSQLLLTGKIDKIYQPEQDELVFIVHTKNGNLKLYASCNPSHSGCYITTESFENPAEPLSFCMLMRKHFSGSRITKIAQKESDRIIEIDVDTVNELGFSVKKALIFEIMGKHSNIIAIDRESGKIIDCIKHISIDVNRARQLLPGKIYEYPPMQEKTPLDQVTEATVEGCLTGKDVMSRIMGVSPALADTLADTGASGSSIYEAVVALRDSLAAGTYTPCVYLDDANSPVEFHMTHLSTHEGACTRIDFETISETLQYFYKNKATSSRIKQKSSDLAHSAKAALSKFYLKKQRLSEDLLKAENSDEYRLYGELLTANIHMIKPGMDKVTLLNYYDGTEITIPLDVRFSAGKNAQVYFKKYGKARTAIKEKATQLEEVNADIEYLESVNTFIENASTASELEELRNELIEQGYLRRKKNNFRLAKTKTNPIEFRTSEGYRVLVGRNNKENDFLTFKSAGKTDVWFHTKDIPGSHVILFTEGTPIDDLSETTIFECAGLAAYHSKGRDSENVPVDYVQARYVKKPNGAKPGMVIFTNNRTVWTNPKLIESK